MKRPLAVALALATACSSPTAPLPAGTSQQAFCEPVVAVYQQIDPADVASVRAVVVAISEGVTDLDEINRAVFAALGAELQVTLTGGVWSTEKLATELNALCDVDLTVWASP